MIIFKSIREAIIWVGVKRPEIDLMWFTRDISHSGITKINGEIFIVDEFGILD